MTMEFPTWELCVQSFMNAKMHAGLHVKCPSLLSDLNLRWNVLANFSKTVKCKISSKPESEYKTSAVQMQKAD
jgi:hypothetical protein